MEESIAWLVKFAASLSDNYGSPYSYGDLMQDLANSGRSGLIARVGEDGDTFAMNKLDAVWKHYRIVMPEPKEFLVDIDSIQKIDDGYIFAGRNGRHTWRLGDYMNGCEIVKIEAYQLDIPELASGMTGIIKVRGHSLYASMKEYKSWKKQV